MARPSRRDEVGALLSQGKSVAEIATALGISKPQVYNYKRALEGSGASAPSSAPRRERGGAKSTPRPRATERLPEDRLGAIDARIEELRSELEGLQAERGRLVEEQRRYHAERLAALGGGTEFAELERLRATVADLEAKLAMRDGEGGGYDASDDSAPRGKVVRGRRHRVVD